MKPHVRIYLQHFGYISPGYQPVDYDDIEKPPCEICSSPSVDIHHIEARGMGGSKLKDMIENLIALCRGCHDKYGDITDYKEVLQEIHNKHLEKAA